MNKLSAHQFIAIIIRLFVIWYVIFLIKELPASFIAEFKYTGTIIPIKIVIAFLLIFIGIMLWFLASKFAAVIISLATSETPIPWTEKQLLTIGSSIVGLWVMLSALSSIIYFGTLWFLSVDAMSGWALEHTISFWTAFIIFAIGAWLFIGSRGLWFVWSYIRGRAQN